MTTIAGKLLRIDLSNKSRCEEEIPEAYYRKFISARGLGAKYLYDELNSGIDPLSPENKLLMLIGALGATGLQGFSKWVVMAKSPLTGTIMRSYTGGNFGVWMKFAGYDMIIIEGKADKPSYVYIDQEGVQFLDASDLSGLDPRLVQQRLKDSHGPKTESACIGLAGEKLVRYAVITSGERTASRGGMGMVMGSKNLKAIAINVPVQKITAFDEGTFKGLVKDQISMLKEHPRRKKMNSLGTPYATVPYMKRGILPVRNFREGSIENIEEISGEEFYRMKKKKAGCYSCMTKCGGMRDVKRGPLGGSQIDGPEYETIYALGSLLGITDKQFIIDANAMCDYYGFDTISAGVSIAFACELFEKGIITTSDTDGFELNWGNKDAILALIEKIGKREGIGYLLGEGVKRASEQMGGETAPYAIHIKGLELPGYEPRAVKGYGLSMATSNIGASHMYGRPKAEMAGTVDPLTEEGKGASIIQAQKEQAIEDSLIACSFGNSGLDFQKYSEFLLAATGIKEFADVANLMEVGERIVCLERCFNIREGFRRKDDTLPRRMLSEPLRQGGPAENQTVEGFDKLLDEYYEAAGYTKEGIPTVEKLKDLGIEEAIKVMHLEEAR
jgi:aldehyde:ferredoxin oxidoreductase